MQTKDWPVVVEARKAAEAELEFYTTMMATKVERNTPKMLTDSVDGIYPIYAQQYLRRGMCKTYAAYDPTHECDQCKLKT